MQPVQATVFHDPIGRGIYLALLITARRGFAGRSQDSWSLSRGDLVWVTGKHRYGAQLRALQRVTDALGWRHQRNEAARTVRVWAPHLSTQQRWLRRGRPRTAQPDILVYTSIQHPDPDQPARGQVFAAPETRGVWLALLISAARSFAGERGDRVFLMSSELSWITGRESREHQRRLLEAVCKPLEYPLAESLEGILVTVRHLSHYQPWGDAQRRTALRTGRAQAAAEHRSGQLGALVEGVLGEFAELDRTE